MWTGLSVAPWKSQSERQRTWINGESTSIVWPTLGSRTAKERNGTNWIGAVCQYGFLLNALPFWLTQQQWSVK